MMIAPIFRNFLNICIFSYCDVHNVCFTLFKIKIYFKAQTVYTRDTERRCKCFMGGIHKNIFWMMVERETVNRAVFRRMLFDLLYMENF